MTIASVVVTFKCTTGIVCSTWYTLSSVSFSCLHNTSVVDLVSRVCFVLVAVDTCHWLVVLCACAKLCELVFGLSSCQDVVVFRVLGYSSIKRV